MQQDSPFTLVVQPEGFQVRLLLYVDHPLLYVDHGLQNGRHYNLLLLLETYPNMRSNQFSQLRWAFVFLCMSPITNTKKHKFWITNMLTWHYQEVLANFNKNLAGSRSLLLETFSRIVSFNSVNIPLMLLLPFHYKRRWQE